MRRTFGGLLALVIAAGIALPAAAQGRHEGWHDRDIHRFHDHDFDHWRHGRWFHGRRGDRIGWWWIVGGVWYFYPAPVYPYPDPFVPPVAAPVPVPPGQQFWYYCDRPRGYYPYVPACRLPWRAIPAG